MNPKLEIFFQSVKVFILTVIFFLGIDLYIKVKSAIKLFELFIYSK